jgi:hypothetical protein
VGTQILPVTCAEPSLMDPGPRHVLELPTPFTIGDQDGSPEAARRTYSLRWSFRTRTLTARMSRNAA